MLIDRLEEGLGPDGGAALRRALYGRIVGYVTVAEVCPSHRLCVCVQAHVHVQAHARV